jgi:hypothetical protein
MRQYGNSPTLLRLLDDFDQWCDLQAFRDGFLSNVWDISQAQGFGLDIWGRILGVSRYIAVEPTPIPGDTFGFVTSDNAWSPWSQAPFWGGTSGGNLVVVKLLDVDYRQLLMVKAASNIASCDAPSLNALVRSMFGSRGKCYVLYGAANMTMEYHFEFTPTPYEQAVIVSGLFPVPAGVTATYITN